LNPNRPFAASYDQRRYEKTIPPLHVLSRALWHPVSPGSNRSANYQSDSADRSSGRDSGNVNSGARININGSTQCDIQFNLLRSRGQDSPETGEKAWSQARDYHRYR